MNDQNRHGDFAMDEPPPGTAEPVDVIQVRADDALIAALSGAGELRVDDPVDERLAGLLRSWREDVQGAEPDFPLIDVSAATAAVATAPRPRARQSPFGPWATAAAVLVVAFVGLGLAAKGAEPGDALWNVTKVLYSEKARSVEAAATVRSKLDEASNAIKTGDITAAMVALEEAKTKLPVIAVEDGQQDLASRTEQLIAELSTPAPTPTSPPSSVVAPTSSAEPTSTSETAPSTTEETTSETGPQTSTTPATTTTEAQPSAGPGGGPGSVTGGDSPAAGAGGGSESGSSGTSGAGN